MDCFVSNGPQTVDYPPWDLCDPLSQVGSRISSSGDPFFGVVRSPESFASTGSYDAPGPFPTPTRPIPLLLPFRYGHHSFRVRVTRKDERRLWTTKADEDHCRGPKGTPTSQRFPT